MKVFEKQQWPYEIFTPLWDVKTSVSFDGEKKKRQALWSLVISFFVKVSKCDLSRSVQILKSQTLSKVRFRCIYSVLLGLKKPLFHFRNGKCVYYFFSIIECSCLSCLVTFVYSVKMQVTVKTSIMLENILIST